MIRSLMTGSAVLALISTGAVGVAQGEDTTAKPAVVQQDNATATPAPVKLVAQTRFSPQTAPSW
jgi:predicted outer membrane protein